MSAIFTLLYDVSYLPGSLLLGSIIKDMIKHSEEDITLGVLIDKLVLTPVQLELVEALYDDLIEVSMVETTLLDKLINDLKRPELDKTFSKIHLWSLLHYDKILYLDSDTLPNSESNLLDLLKLNVDDGKIYASPDSGFPDIFNSGMFLLKPNRQDFDNLTSLVNSKGEISFDGADQGLLNQYFNSNPDWVGPLVSKNIKGVNVDSLHNNWVKLPFLYNVTPSCQYQYLPAYNYFSSNQLFPTNVNVNPINPPHPLPPTKGDSEAVGLLGYGYTATKHFNNQVKLIHFIGPYKPWNYPHSPSHLQWWSLWYKYYTKETLDAIKSAVKQPHKSSTSTPTYYTYASKDSLWDPSTSSPPKSTEVVPTFKPTKFHNKWDDQKSSPPANHHVKFSEPATIKDLEKESKFGHHFHQKPERSFNDTQHFVPTHPMIAKLKDGAKQDTVAKGRQSNAKSGRSSPGVNAKEVGDKLEKLVLENLNE